MIASVRSSLMAGIAVAGAMAITVAPVEVPPPDVTPPANRSASVGVVSQARVELLAAIQQMAAAPVATAAVNPSPMAAAQPLSAASDFIINAWNAAVPWINYGVDLADYVLGFIPFGYLIGDQISIVWYSFGLPVANSFVLDLVAPVVNDPLNLSTWVGGLAAVGSTTVTSLINLGISEFNYFFGWLIPPIPPLPLTAVAADATDIMAASIEASELVGDDAEETEGTSEHLGEDVTKDETVAAEQDVTDEDVVVEEAADEESADEDSAEEESADEDAAEEKANTTDSSGAVTAQGEVRGWKLSPSTETDVDQSDPNTPAADDQHDNPADSPAETPSSNDDGPGSDDTEGDGGEE